MRLAFLSILLLLPSAGLAQLTDPESRMVRHIDGREAEARRLLEASVNINSGTMNFAGVRRCGDLFGAELDRLGFTTEWVDGSAFERAGHLFAHRAGTGPHVLLIGHLDTVFEPDSPFQSYQELGDGRAKGPGTTDMKGGNVILISALDALAAAGQLDRLEITVALIGDEEKVGSPVESARARLIEAARAAQIVLGFEDGDGDPATAVISRRSSSRWELRVSGTPAHSSQVFTDAIGPGAIFEMARILDGFRRELSGQDYLTFNPGIIVGGTEISLDPAQGRGTAFGKNNVIAESAVVTGDLRSISFPQLEKARAAMRRIVAASLPHCAAEIQFEDRYPPLAPDPGNRRLLSAYDRASRDLGFGPVTAVDPRKAGAADVSFTAGHVAMVIDGLGLMGTGGHTVEETADLATLTSQAKRAAVLLARIANGDVD